MNKITNKQDHSKLKAAIKNAKLMNVKIFADDAGDPYIESAKGVAIYCSRDGFMRNDSSVFYTTLVAAIG